MRPPADQHELDLSARVGAATSMMSAVVSVVPSSDNRSASSPAAGPIASSSAMCLSRAWGSRPVQPAITAWSIDKVRASPRFVHHGEGQVIHGSCPPWRRPVRRCGGRAASRGEHEADGHSPSRCPGSEMAQPSITLISTQLRRERRFAAKALSSSRSAMRGGVFAVVG